ncbi:sensor histidine kinase [Paenibacillus psychroresistens]|uniref:histidine kinase n=1 Tax=Paenibacillus psychroresistens TaxID=1778678 RepID=A0A6B8RTN2_9BACL|nr:HAMP domain-containing sensor histidine kinase [Paenibacillus psychroresistens]QGQ99751.1 sensor histidine kinase [Paenibacillus psychroresistens]
MKKRSVTFKLFMITLLSFSLFLGVFMAGQTLFYKSFYLSMKKSKLENSIEKFSLLYEKEKWDSADITRNVNKFADQNNTQIAILDEKGTVKFTPAYDFIVETTDKQQYKIPLNNIVYLEEFQKLKLAIGLQVEVEGIIDDTHNQVSYLSSISNDNEKWENSNLKIVNATTAANPNFTLSGITQTTLTPVATLKKATAVSIVGIELSQKKIDGKIIALEIPTQISQMASYNKELLWSSIDYWNGLKLLNHITIEPGKTIQFQYTSPSNGMDNIVFAKPVTKDDGTSEYVFAISSLQPVGEAVDVMKNYYIYGFLVALILIAAMALLFSKIITKPLIKMNQVAARMANLDFSEEVPVKSTDELGNMAVSLNRLSRNLGSSLSELKVANEQLQLDIEKEKLLETMRKEFVASVSHELKTPLGIIKGFAEGVKDNIAEHKREHYIDVILDEIDKMDDLVLDLLDLAKLESKAYKLDAESFDIMDLVGDVEARLINRIKEKRITIKHETETLKVYGDFRRIEQVITNILNNAIRHTDYEGSITIGTSKLENKVHIYIENSGSPIAEDDLKLIWDRFYRAEKSRDRKTGGTGLGLSIVKNILEMHDSRFGVENTDNGVRFYFTLMNSH